MHVVSYNHEKGTTFPLMTLIQSKINFNSKLLFGRIPSFLLVEIRSILSMKLGEMLEISFSKHDNPHAKKTKFMMVKILINLVEHIFLLENTFRMVSLCSTTILSVLDSKPNILLTRGFHLGLDDGESSHIYRKSLFLTVYSF